MKLLSTSQAASKVGVTSQTIRNWIDEGILKAKRVGNVFYVRASTIEALVSFDEEDNLHAIRESLDKEKKAYIKEYEEYKALRNDMRFEKERARLSYIAINSGVRNNFFKTIVDILRITNNLKEREANVLIQALKGDSYSAIADNYGLTRERLRQLIEKAMRKCSELTALEEVVNRLPEVEKENSYLKAEIEKLKNFIAENNPEVEKVVKESEIDKIVKILDKKIVDCNLSIRAINGLRAGRVEYHYSHDVKECGNKVVVPECKTIGDICRLRKDDLSKIRNFGKKTISEIEDFLYSNNLSFEMDVDAIYKQKMLTK